MISRRKFVKVIVLSPHLLGSGALLLLSDRADAFLPFFVRFIVGGFVRGAVIRTVVSQAVRSAPLAVTSMASAQTTRNVAATRPHEYGKKTAIRGSVATQFGFSAGLSVSVSPNVLAKAQEFAADAIWIRADVQNSFELEVHNNSDQVLNEKIAIFLRDVEKDSITNQMYYDKYTAQPNSVSRIPFRISNLPYNGVVRLSAQSTASELRASSSGNIVVAERSEIEFST
jgi:hypothetical protein